MIRILQQRVTWRPVTLIACETALIFGAVVAATYLRLGDDAWEMVGAENVLPKGILIAFVCQMCLYYGDLYNLPLVTDRRELIVRTLQALGAASLVLALVYFWFPFLVVGRGVFTLVAVMVVGGVLGLARLLRLAHHPARATRTAAPRRDAAGLRDPGARALRAQGARH